MKTKWPIQGKGYKSPQSGSGIMPDVAAQGRERARDGGATDGDDAASKSQDPIAKPDPRAPRQREGFSGDDAGPQRAEETGEPSDLAPHQAVPDQGGHAAGETPERSDGSSRAVRRPAAHGRADGASAAPHVKPRG